MQLELGGIVVAHMSAPACCVLRLSRGQNNVLSRHDVRRSRRPLFSRQAVGMDFEPTTERLRTTTSTSNEVRSETSIEGTSESSSAFRGPSSLRWKPGVQSLRSLLVPLLMRPWSLSCAGWYPGGRLITILGSTPLNLRMPVTMSGVKGA